MSVEQGTALQYYFDAMSNEERVLIKSLAFHEAGHAVFLWRHGGKLGRFGLSLNPHDKCGLCTQDWFMRKSDHQHVYAGPAWVHEFDLAELQYVIAGPAAGDKFLKSQSEPPKGFSSSYSDYDVAKYIVERHFYSVNPEEQLRKHYKIVSRLLNNPKTWAAVEAVAQTLLKFNYLNHDELIEIIRPINPPQVKEDSYI